MPSEISRTEISKIKTLWLAMRPFSLPASAMPVLFGTALAVTVGGADFKPLLFVLALIGMMAIHGGANALNDACDYVRGIDRNVYAGSGAVVRGLLTPSAAQIVASWLIGFGVVLGIIISLVTTWRVFVIGVVGVAGCVFYSRQNGGLKYVGLGDLAVFLIFGLLGCLGAWTVQAETCSWIPVLWSAPMSLVIIGILHANNWRDIEADKAGGYWTVASLLGDIGSLWYYGALIFLPFVLVALFTQVQIGDLPKMPLRMLAVFLAFPLAVKLFRQGLRRQRPEHQESFFALDAATGKFHLIFSLLCAAAIIAG